MEMKMQIWTYGVALMLAAGTIGTAHAQDSVTLMHVHGLSYSGDGKRLMIPSHHGVAVYENGKWSKAPGPQHDYMGFSATSKHLYSRDRKSTRLNSSHGYISYAVFCLKKKKRQHKGTH